MCKISGYQPYIHVIITLGPTGHDTCGLILWFDKPPHTPFLVGLNKLDRCNTLFHSALVNLDGIIENLLFIIVKDNIKATSSLSFALLLLLLEYKIHGPCVDRPTVVVKINECNKVLEGAIASISSPDDFCG